MAKKKEKMSWKDTLFWYGSVYGALFVLVACAPPVPWRFAAPSSSFGQHFIVSRQMSLFTVTNQYNQATAWFKMKAEICRKMEDMNRPNPLAVGLSLGSMVLSSSSEGQMSTGGAVLGCAAWPACKEAVATRCSTYTSVAMVGLVAFLLMLFGAIAAVMGIIFMAKEANVKKGESEKKKKKREEAQWNTALAGCFGFVLSFLGTVGYLVVSDTMFKSLQMNSHYPFPAVYVGVYLAAFGEFLLFIAMVCGIRRQDYYQEVEDEEEEEEVYAPGVGANGQAPYQAPPGMGGPMPAAGGFAPIGGMPGQSMPRPPPM